MNIKFSVAIGIICFWVIVGTIGIYLLEDRSWIKSFYFAVTTLSTVGYGDVIPTNDISRLFTSLYILFGVTSVIGGSMSVIGNHTINHGESKIRDKLDTYKKRIFKK